VRQLIAGGADLLASYDRGDGAPTPLGLARALLARDPAHDGTSLVVVAAGPWSRENHALSPRTRARGRLSCCGSASCSSGRRASRARRAALLDVWPARLILHAALVGRRATLKIGQRAGGEVVLGREGVVSAVFGEWESFDLDFDDGERVTVPVASVDLELTMSAHPGANRRLTATLDGRKMCLVAWAGWTPYLYY
jgi:hypothetical protein